jgi:glycosyltransferase involved in cell wall biosynthesis
MAFSLTVVISTYNRLALLEELLDALGRQTLAPARFEVVVVDDGSRTPVAPALEARRDAYRLIVLSQANGGAAAARDAGIQRAGGEVIVVTDDDMLVPPEFLEEHLKAHEAGHTVVLGHIAPEPGLPGKPLFERFHADQLARFVRTYGARPTQVRGTMVCTGNVSFRREEYLRVGGFDRSLDRSEDRELGVRLEKAGGRLYFAEAARTVNRSDHTDLSVWMRRNYLYGVYDSRIHHKHPDELEADPWHFLFLINPVSRVLMLATLVVPPLGEVLSHAAYGVAETLDRRRELHPRVARAALAGAALSYGLEYFRGVREEAGSLRGAASALVSHTWKRLRRRAGA